MYQNNLKKIILLTGCTGTLGSHFVKSYSHKYQIVGIARNKPQFSTAMFDFFQGDVNTDFEKLVDYTLLKYKSIDALINNAAFWLHQNLINVSADSVEQHMRTNVITPLLLSNEVMNKFWAEEGLEKNSKRGRCVVNVSSISGVNAHSDDLGVYAATKAALNMLTKYMGREYQVFGVRVNAVAPTAFPNVVGTDKVASAIADFIEIRHNSVIKVMGQNQEYAF